MKRGVSTAPVTVTNAVLAEGAIGEYLKSVAAGKQRWIALSEERLWELASPDDKQKQVRHDYLNGLTGGNKYQIRSRRALLRAPDLLWDRIDGDDKMLLASAVRVFREARALAKENSWSVEKALSDVLAMYDRTPIHRTANGGTYCYRQRSATREESTQRRAASAKAAASESTGRGWWARLKLVVGHIVGESVPDGVDDLIKHELHNWLHNEIKSTIEEFARRASSARSQNSGMVEIGRRQVVSACRILHVDPPYPGQLPDMRKARTAKRLLARSYHPDANRGDEAMRQLYESVIDAYVVIETYAGTLSKKDAGTLSKKEKRT